MRHLFKSLYVFIMGLALVVNVQAQYVMTLHMNDTSWVNFNTGIIDSMVWVDELTETDGLPNDSTGLNIDIHESSHVFEFSEIDSITWKTTEIGKPIDLGLSIRWASFNVGSSDEPEYGTYYSWADIRYRNKYDWESNRWFNDIDSLFYKYSYNAKTGEGDSIIEIELNDDVAFVEWGESWRTPTADELYELYQECDWYRVEKNDTVGAMGVSTINGDSIFLPAAGFSFNDSINYSNITGYYWSSTLDTADNENSIGLYFDFDSNVIDLDYIPRIVGINVRPVSPYPPYELVYKPINGLKPHDPADTSDVDIPEIIDELELDTLKPGDPHYNPEESNDPNNPDSKIVIIRWLPVTNLEINKKACEIYVNERIKLSAKAKCGLKTIGADIKWYSSDPSVAQVSKNGVVTGIHVGECIIYAKYKDKVAGCRVIVKLKSVEITENKIVMSIGQKQKLHGQVWVRYGTINLPIVWYSDDESVATVDDSGVVTAVNVGECKIYAECQGYSDYCIVEVRPTDIQIEKEIVLEEGEQYQLHARVFSGNTEVNVPLDWRCSNLKLATVSSNGLVTANSSGYEGSCEISVSYENLSAKCKVTVVIPGFYLNRRLLSLNEGETFQLLGFMRKRTDIESINASSITFNTTDPDVATVTSEGLVKAVTEGVCQIKAVYFDKTNNKEYSFVCVVYVDAPNVVDLGLSVKWATYNVGAVNPEDKGSFYAWGEVNPKESSYHSWSDYKWCTEHDFLLTKYCTESSEGYNNLVDNLITLEEEDDVAHVVWGGDWRMPTKKEYEELLKFCTFTWTRQNGRTTGVRITSNIVGYEDRSIFLPVNDYLSIRYWSSSLYLEFSHDAWALDESENKSFVKKTSKRSRYEGLLIRPCRTSNSWPGITSVVLNEENKQMICGEVFKMTATVYSGEYDYSFFEGITWSSSNESVASVDDDGKVCAISEGTSIITATYIDGTSADCTVTVSYGAIDMGLSVKWATNNIGAANPENSGYYFAWGETYVKTSSFDWSTYKYCRGSDIYSTCTTITKYCTDSFYGNNGFTDGKNELDLDDDVANVRLGGNWRMPTHSELNELFNYNNCSWCWTSRNGINGYLVTSKKRGYEGNSVFLPAAGFIGMSTLFYAGTYGAYWTRECVADHAYCMTFDSDGWPYCNDSWVRSDGLVVRPVLPK